MINNFIKKIYDLQKNNDKKSVLYHPGRYKFYFPYAAFHSVADDNGFVPIYMCEVEIFVGQEIDLKEGYIATVIIHADKEGVGITNFIEMIATKIRWCFFDVIFYEKMDEPTNPFLEKIRWIEHYPEEYLPSCFPNGKWDIVTMQWDEKSRMYYDPCWSNYIGIYSKELKLENIETGKIYEAEVSLSEFPNLGSRIYVLVIESYNNLDQVVVIPIVYNSVFDLKKDIPIIRIGENNYGIDESYIFRFDKVRNINKNLLKLEVGKLSQKQLKEAISFWDSLSCNERELIELIPYKKDFIQDKYVDMEEDRTYEFKSVNA